jgi:hypothetical protein
VADYQKVVLFGIQLTEAAIPSLQVVDFHKKGDGGLSKAVFKT